MRGVVDWGAVCIVWQFGSVTGPGIGAAIASDWVYTEVSGC